MLLGLALGLTGAGCSAIYEDALHRDLADARLGLAEPGETLASEPDGSVTSYVAYAMAQSPELRASYERWQAASLRISSARRLPEPMVVYAFYALPVQTRVGPQRHRVSVQQSFPWPTRLTAAADAQSARARASQRRFEAQALALARQVSDAWWMLWYVRRAREVDREQLEILDGLSQTLRARVESSQASLADLAQVDLTRSRIDDAIAGLDEMERSAEAALRGVISAPAGMPLPTHTEVTGAALPGEELGAMAEAVRAHPFLQSFELLAEANEAQAAAYEADRFPRFTVGMDWIETGPALMPATQGSGDDAVITSLGLSVPLWQDSYDDMQRSAEAEAAGDRADRERAEDAALAELEQALSAVRDSYRRVRLYRDTLLPQAQTAYESVIGAYAVGRATVAATLIAQRDLLELSLGLMRARADHGNGWARLERVVGRPVEAVLEDTDAAPPVIDEAAAPTAPEE
jgi:outer membrane protein TolC